MLPGGMIIGKSQEGFVASEEGSWSSSIALEIASLSSPSIILITCNVGTDTTPILLNAIWSDVTFWIWTSR